MFKYLKRLFGKRNSAGFTLVEVVVSVALLGIMLVGILAFTAPVLASVAEKQQDAQAVMLMEAIDSYITANLRNAKYVKVVSNVNLDDPDTFLNATWIDELNKMAEIANNSGGEDELCAIGFRWRPTGIYNEYKLILTREYLNYSGGTFNDFELSQEVMGDSIYNDLYIVPQFEMISSNPSDPSNPETHNIGIVNTTRVYRDPNCYSTSAINRKSSSLSYVGQSYNGFTTIASQFVNRYDSSTGYKYKAYDVTDMFTYDADGNYVSGYSSTNAPVALSPDGDVGVTYFPETYIFYVARNRAYDVVGTP